MIGRGKLLNLSQHMKTTSHSDPGRIKYKACRDINHSVQRTAELKPQLYLKNVH